MTTQYKLQPQRSDGVLNWTFRITCWMTRCESTKCFVTFCDISMVLWADIASCFGILSGSCGMCQVVPERVVKTASTATSLPPARHPDLLTFCDSCCAHFSAHFSALQPAEPGLDHDHPNRGYEGQETGSVHDVSFIFFRILESFPDFQCLSCGTPFHAARKRTCTSTIQAAITWLTWFTACWKVGIQKNYLALQPLRIAACDDDIWPRWFPGAVQHRWHCQCCCSSRWDLRIIENLWVVDTWWQHGDNVTDVIGDAWKVTEFWQVPGDPDPPLPPPSDYPPEEAETGTGENSSSQVIEHRSNSQWIETDLRLISSSEPQGFHEVDLRQAAQFWTCQRRCL